MNPPFVFLDGFRCLKVSYSPPPRRFFQELLTLNLIIHHAVRRIVRKSIKFCFILTSKLWNEQSITHVSSTRPHFYVKFRPRILVTNSLCAFRSLSWLHGEQSKCDQFLENLLGGLYDTFKQRKPSMKTNCGFMNGIKSSSENLSQEKIRNAINLQTKIMKAIAINGGHTNYMIRWSMS